jgi:hypothetical protein
MTSIRDEHDNSTRQVHQHGKLYSDVVLDGSSTQESATGLRRNIAEFTAFSKTFFRRRRQAAQRTGNCLRSRREREQENQNAPHEFLMPKNAARAR